MNIKEAYRISKEIEAFVLDKEATGQPYTEDDIAYINQYTGFGGMWDLDKKLEADRGLYEYYTPWEVCAKMMGLAIMHGYQPGQPMCEPSCGVGRFLHYAQPGTPVLACEPDKVSYLIAKANFPAFQVLNQTFNALFVERNGKAKPVRPGFNLVIGNPPYGAFKGVLTTQERATTGAQNYPDYFVRRSADILFPGGICAFIIPSAFLNAAEGQIQSDIKKLFTLVDAYRMPISTFEGQTDVATDIVILKKNA
jgi:type I restriction-modification system DNA methylase subunit